MDRLLVGMTLLSMIAAAPAAAGPEFAKPVAMAMDGNGDLIIADAMGPGEIAIVRFNPDGGDRERLHVVDGAALFADFDPHRPLFVKDITATPNGDAYMTAWRNVEGSGFWNYVIRLPAGGSPEILHRSNEKDIPGLERIYGVIYTPDRRLIAAGGMDTLFEFDPKTGEPRLVFGPGYENDTSEFTVFHDIEADGEGNLYVCEALPPNMYIPHGIYKTISRIDLESGGIERIAESGTEPPNAEAVLSMTLRGGRFIVYIEESFDRRRIVQIDLGTGRQSVISDYTRTNGLGFISPAEIVAGEDGFLYTADANLAGGGGAAGVVRVNPDNGRMEVAAGSDIDPTPRFRLLRAAEALPDGTVLLLDRHPVLRPGFGAIFRLDPATGVRWVISDRTRGVCASLMEPVDLEIDAQGRCVVFDNGFYGRKLAYIFDPDTGETLGSYNLAEWTDGRYAALPAGGAAMAKGGFNFEFYTFDDQSEDMTHLETLGNAYYSGRIDNVDRSGGLYDIAVRKDGTLLLSYSRFPLIYGIDPVWNSARLRFFFEDFGVRGLRASAIETDGGDILYALDASREHPGVTALDLERRTARRISEKSAGWYDMTILPNGNLVTISDLEVFLVDVETGDTSVIAANNGRIPAAPVEGWLAY